MKTITTAGRRLLPSRFGTFGWERRFRLLAPQSYDVALAIAVAVCVAGLTRTLVG